MSAEVLMPALSPTMTEGKIARWLKKEGDQVKSGDVLAEIETDKATMEVEAVDEGKLGKILIPGGTEGVKVNTPIAVILDDGEDAGSVQAKPTASVNAPSDAQAPAAAPVVSTPASPAVATVTSTRPAAVRPAEERVSGNVTTLTVRDALRDAMAEEMRRDK